MRRRAGEGEMEVGERREVLSVLVSLLLLASITVLVLVVLVVVVDAVVEIGKAFVLQLVSLGKTL